MQVTVIGAGVIGLACAHELAHAHEVTVIALDASTTSEVAGAVWFPYRAGPAARVADWARRTRARLDALPPEAGVDVLDAVELCDERAPWWLPAIPDAREEPRGVWRFRAPRIEPARLLAWLARGLTITRARVDDLQAVGGDLVINATGLGARVLADDPTVSGLAGQVVITEPGAIDLGRVLADDRDESRMFYAIPRRDEVVLGGSAIAADTLPAVDPALSARILADAAAHGLSPGAIKRVQVGLRPVRPEVRLERVGRVIHCYGHGGAGFTLCFGCAEDVAALVT